MRNLSLHPVTAEEMLEALDWALEEYDRQFLSVPDPLVGDVRGVALQKVRDVITFCRDRPPISGMDLLEAIGRSLRQQGKVY